MKEITERVVDIFIVTVLISNFVLVFVLLFKKFLKSGNKYKKVKAKDMTIYLKLSDSEKQKLFEEFKEKLEKEENDEK